MTTFVLVHSPLLTPSAWQLVAQQLQTAGHKTIIPSLVEAAESDGPFYQKLHDAVAVVAASAASKSISLVAHSAAGALLPGIAAQLERQIAVESAIWVDALLPHPGQSWFDTAAPDLASRLRALAVDDRLPPWDQWFGSGMLAALIPDPALRASLVAGLPRLPVAHFAEVLPPLPALPRERCGYLQLSAAYDGQAAQAEQANWTVRRLNAHHLAPLTDAPSIASLILDIAVELLHS